MTGIGHLNLQQTLEWLYQRTRPQVFSAYDAAGGIDCSSGYTDITWDTEVRKDANYTHSASSAEITIAEAGDYLVECQLTMTVNGTATTSKAKWQKNSGGGYSDLAGTFSGTIHNLTNSYGTMSMSRVVTFAAGDLFKVVASKDLGTATLTTAANGSRLTIMRVR